MHSVLRNQLTSFCVLVAASAALPAAALHFLLSEGSAPVSAQGHVVLVAIGAGVGLVAALAVLASGARRGDGRAVAVGGALAAMTVMLLVHALATPTVLIGENGLVAAAGAAALPLGGLLLALAALPGLDRAVTVRRLVVGELSLLALLVIGGAVALSSPGAVPALPRPASPLALGALAAGTLLLGTVAVRAVRTFTLTRRVADLAVVVGTVWLAAALVPTFLLQPGGWAWWLGHALEMVGLVLVAAPVALDLHRGVQSRPLTGDLRAERLVADAEAFLGPRVRALLVRLTQKDLSTADHTVRVALRAVQVGEHLGLAPGRLRDLALGGILHDIGKLSVPDAVLRKPGPLDDDEFAVIKRHPEWGDALLSELGFSQRVRRMVHGHHERLDGRGYPRGLTASDLDLETRILAVCDVYDALVSDRVYRAAWSPERAMALLEEEAGSAHDAACVAALEAVLRATDALAEPRAAVMAAAGRCLADDAPVPERADAAPGPA